MSSSNLLVCERCGFTALVPDTAGWQMTSDENGLCPACVKDDRAPNGKAAAKESNAAN